MGLISFVGVWLLSIFLKDNTTLSNAQPKITMLYMEDDCLLILNCSCQSALNIVFRTNLIT